LTEWTAAPTYTIVGVSELYEQLLPTKVYTSAKTGTNKGNVMYRQCGKVAETLPHVLSGCSALAQYTYLERHNNALKILFFEVCKELRLIDSVPPRYTPVVPTPVYEVVTAQAYWDVPVCVDHNFVKANTSGKESVGH